MMDMPNTVSTGLRMKTFVCTTDHELHVWIARHVQQGTLPTQFQVLCEDGVFEVSYVDVQEAFVTPPTPMIA